MSWLLPGLGIVLIVVTMTGLLGVQPANGRPVARSGLVQAARLVAIGIGLTLVLIGMASI